MFFSSFNNDILHGVINMLCQCIIVLHMQNIFNDVLSR